MKTNQIVHRALLISALLATPFTSLAQTPADAPKPAVNRLTGAAPDARWEEEYAYALGTTAYVHLFPWMFFSHVRYVWATQGRQNMQTPQTPPNVLSRTVGLSDHRHNEGGRPNVDTLYSSGFFDVSQEPVILTVPDMSHRPYFSVEMCAFNADNFDYISKRTTGIKAGVYAMVGPHWKGKLPKGVKAMAASPTNWIFPLVRVYVHDQADVIAALKLQDQVRMEHLSTYLGKPRVTPNDVPQPPFQRANDPLADWKNINRALTESPMPAKEAQIAKMYAQIGIGSGLDVEKMSEAVKRGLARAAKQGAMIVTSAPAANVGRKIVNGWGMTPSNWGRLSVDGDYLRNAAKTLGGFVTHDAEEGIYPATFHDDRGERLNDSRRYELRFEKGQFPPVNAFWSVTLYGPDYNLVDNPIGRYAVSDRTTGAKLGDDGSLTFYIQKDAPSDDKKDNWLPSGAGNFHLVLRTYLPKETMLNGTWQPPAVKRVE